MTQEWYLNLRDDLHAFFKHHFSGYWEVLDTSLTDDGMVYAAWGRMPITDSFTDGIEKVLVKNGYGFGYDDSQILMGLFPA